MYKSRFLIGFLVFVIVAILLAIGGFALYQLGYSQGYTTGLAMSSVEEGAALLPHQSIQPFRILSISRLRWFLPSAAVMLRWRRIPAGFVHDSEINSLSDLAINDGNRPR